MFVSMRRSLVNDEYDDPWHDRYFPSWSLWLGGGLLSINWLWRIWAVLLCFATLTSLGLFIDILINFQPNAPPLEWAFLFTFLLITVISEVLAVVVTAHAAKGSIPLVAAAAGFLFLAAAGLVVIYFQTLVALTLFLPLLPSYRVAALFVYDCTFIRKEVSKMKGSMLTQEQKANSYRVLMARVSQLQQTHKWWLICSSAGAVCLLLLLVFSVITLSKITITPSTAMAFSAVTAMFFAPVVPPLAELVTMGYTNRAIETMEHEFFSQDRVTMLHLQIMREPARLSFLGIPITVNKAVSIAVSFAATAAFQAIRSLWL